MATVTTPAFVAALLAIFEGLARGGASRQVVVVVAAAVIRLGHVGTEMVARLAAIEPVVVARVLAARAGRPAAIPGDARLRRNLAAHHGFGLGPEVLLGLPLDLRRRHHNPCH